MAGANQDYAVMAAASRAAASTEILENVRQKHLTSAATWDGLARAKVKMDALRLHRLDEASAIATDAPTSANELHRGG